MSTGRETGTAGAYLQDGRIAGGYRISLVILITMHDWRWGTERTGGKKEVVCVVTKTAREQWTEKKRKERRKMWTCVLL